MGYKLTCCISNIITMTIEVDTSTTLYGDELCVVINSVHRYGICICAVQGRDLTVLDINHVTNVTTVLNKTAASGWGENLRLRFSLKEGRNQFITSTNWHFAVPMIWQSELSNCEIETVQSVQMTNWRFPVSTIWLNGTLNLWEQNFSICHIDQLTLCSSNNLTKWYFQFVKLKLFKMSNRQIDTLKCRRFVPMMLSTYKCESFQFFKSTNW